jgi:hypothetical protein
VRNHEGAERSSFSRGRAGPVSVRILLPAFNLLRGQRLAILRRDALQKDDYISDMLLNILALQVLAEHFFITRFLSSRGIRSCRQWRAYGRSGRFRSQPEGGILHPFGQQIAIDVSVKALFDIRV